MPRSLWPLRQDQPTIQIVVSSATSGQAVVRHLLADTAAGSARAGFELILLAMDCLHAGGIFLHTLALTGAFVGTYPVYSVRAQIPALGFDKIVRTVGVPTMLPGVDGLAGFRFLNRFSCGNFGDPAQFGLEL